MAWYLQSDGTNASRMAVETAANSPTDSVFTEIFTFKTNNNSSDTDVCWPRKNSGAATDGDNNVFFNSNNKLDFMAGGNHYVSTDTWADGTVHRFAYTYNSASGELKLYVDGVLKDTFTGLSGSISRIGYIGDSNTDSDIQIRNIQRWTQEFTADQILYDYEHESTALYDDNGTIKSDNSGVDVNNLAQWLPCDEGSGTTIEEKVSSTTYTLSDGFQWYYVDESASVNEDQYITTDYILPSNSAWTLIEVAGSDTALDHYAHVYDGSGTLETFKNKTSQGTVSHTPSTAAYVITNKIYNSTDTVTVRRAVVIENRALTATQITKDYEYYFGQSAVPITVLHDTKSQVSTSLLTTTDTQSIVQTSKTYIADSKVLTKTYIQHQVDTQSTIYTSINNHFDTTTRITNQLTNLTDGAAIVKTFLEQFFDTSTEVSLSYYESFSDSEVVVRTAYNTTPDSSVRVLTSITNIADTFLKVYYNKADLCWIGSTFIGEENPILVEKESMIYYIVCGE